MLTSLALIFLLGLLLAGIFDRIKLPGLLGTLLAGIVLGPFALDLIDSSILGVSGELRTLALVVILVRAGLAIDLGALKKVGRAAVLMAFVPACFEIAGVVLLAPRLLGVSVLEAVVMGSVVAAVSPAVVVPRMLKLIERGYGTDKGVPALVMAGASADDVFVIVLFTMFTGFLGGDGVSLAVLGGVPVSIALGVIAGAGAGLLFARVFKKIHVRDSVKGLVLLSACFLLLALEQRLEPYVAFSGLLAIMAMGAAVLRGYPLLAARLSGKFAKLWVAAEVLLFALVGARFDLRYIALAGAKAVLLLLGALAFRMAGVFLCLIKTKLNLKERLFCMIAYVPKATVQAAIGGVPLALGLACGPVVLAVAVLSIVVTAPLGAFGIDLAYKKLLVKSEDLAAQRQSEPERAKTA